mgnify:CR=1 FL=1
MKGSVKMKRLFLKKFLTLLTCFMLITATSMALAAEVSDEGTVEPRASQYLSSYMAYIAPVGSGKIQIWFDVEGTAVMDKIGTTTIVLKESTNGTSFTPVKTFKSTSYSSMIASNKGSYTSYVPYSGTAGRYYQAVVTVYAEKNGGSDSRVITTSTKKAS